MASSHHEPGSRSIAAPSPRSKVFDSPRGARSNRSTPPTRSPVKAPYRAGFQPPGVRRDVTDAFVASRNGHAEQWKLDEARLQRRLERLIAVHFPPPGSTPAARAAAPLNTRLTSLSESLRGKTPRQILQSVASGTLGDPSRDEQTIVKWESDDAVAQCPLCGVTFGLKTRRHHCRLCGRVVCGIPTDGEARTRRCSTFITCSYDEEAAADAYAPVVPSHLTSGTGTPSPSSGAQSPVRGTAPAALASYALPSGPASSSPDTRGGRRKARAPPLITEVPPKDPDASLDAVMRDYHEKREAPPDVPKVRVCRDCLDIVLRHQVRTRAAPVPAFVRLYALLVQLEREIERELSDFEQRLLALRAADADSVAALIPEAKRAQQIRRTLFAALARYEMVAKRIRQLSETDAPEPARIQLSMAQRAKNTMAERVSLIKSLGVLDEEILRDARRRRQGGGSRPLSLISVSSAASSEDTPRVLSFDELMNGPSETPPAVVSHTGAATPGTYSPRSVETPPSDKQEISDQITVLSEQHALVKSYVDDANSKRQFEDAAALKSSLDDLAAEIERLKVQL